MGSSKKHKEKKDKKKHKKRSRSREREKESHKKSHKSSSRKEKKRSLTPDFDSGDEKRRRISDEEASNRDTEMHIEEKPSVCYREPSPDDLFDIDKLLDSKLGEKNETVVDRALKKRSRESAIEEFKRRQNICNKDPVEKVTTERVTETYSHTEVDAAVVDRALKKRSRESAIEEFKRRQNICNKDPVEKVTSERVTETYIHSEVDAAVVDRALKKRSRESAIEEFKRRQNICSKDPIERDTTEHVTENYSRTEVDPAVVDRALKKRSRESAIEEFKRRQNICHKDPIERVTNERVAENYSYTEVDRTVVDRALKKRSRESAIEEFKRHQNICNKDPIERVINERITENYSHTEVKPSISPVPESFQRDKTVEIPFLTDEPEIMPEIKQEPPDDYTEEYVEERTEPQLSLSISETNKLRAKLGLKPLDVGSEISERTEPQRTEPQLSLSVTETNKLRAKLGLKPLDVGSEIPGLSEENAEKEPTKKPEVFVKTENISELKRSEKLRERLKVMKEKRSIEEKLKKTKGVADSDSEEESAADWVVKHQKIVKEKEKAELRAKMLEEMDEEFGVGALIEEEFKNKAYTSKHLKGLTIAHDVGSFKEGTPVILTLKDKGVLDEEEDVLENVNIVDLEKSVKNVENKKKKPDYRPYEEPEFDEFGILQKKSVLSKYDEEIEGEKKKSFKIGTETAPSFTTREQELELIRMKLKQQNKISLEMPELKIANEYYTPSDMVQFKKPKKKKKVRKTPILKADDLLTDEIDGSSDLGSRKRRKIQDDLPYTSDLHDMDDMDVVSEDSNMSNLIIDEDQAEQELYSALNKAKKLKQRKVMSTASEKVIEILHQTSSAGNDSTADAKAANIEMNSVAEFCRTLGDIPTYGMSGNRDEEADDMMDLEREIMEEKQKQELDAQNRGAWNEVDIDEKPAEISVRENEPILEEEPDINHGIAGALKLAQKKGYLDKDSKKAAGAPRTSTLQAQSYTIEEKFYEDDKFGKRDRYTGPIQDFREKSNYKPDVKLEYIDDSGRLLTAKEAFRYLSHKFHGKGPGKNKVDKRMKKLEQETRLKQMSSTDTPLNTVKLLQAKQKETQSPYIVLSGGNKTLTQTMISKTKM